MALHGHLSCTSPYILLLLQLTSGQTNQHIVDILKFNFNIPIKKKNIGQCLTLIE